MLHPHLSNQGLRERARQRRTHSHHPPRSDRLEIYHRGTVRSASLSKFRGTWVETHVKARHDNGGSLEVTLKRVGDGGLLHSYSASNIDMWDDGAGYGAPKFGLYRSLDSRSSIRDEDVLFADFAVTLGEVEAPLTVNALSLPPARGFAIHSVTGERASFSLDRAGICRIAILEAAGRTAIPPILLDGAPGLNREEPQPCATGRASMSSDWSTGA